MWKVKKKKKNTEKFLNIWCWNTNSKSKVQCNKSELFPAVLACDPPYDFNTALYCAYHCTTNAKECGLECALKMTVPYGLYWFIIHITFFSPTQSSWFNCVIPLHGNSEALSFHDIHAKMFYLECCCFWRRVSYNVNRHIHLIYTQPDFTYKGLFKR